MATSWYVQSCSSSALATATAPFVRWRPIKAASSPNYVPRSASSQQVTETRPDPTRPDPTLDPTRPDLTRPDPTRCDTKRHGLFWPDLR